MATREEGRQARGLIMALEGRMAVVLTHEGEFRRVPLDRADRQVGEEMPLGVPLPHRTPGWLSWLPRWNMTWSFAAAATMAAVLLVALLPGALRHPAPGATQEMVLAYVSVDINPSLELGVGHSGRVETARALNQDASLLLSQVHVQAQPLAEALVNLTAAAVERGYVAPEKANSVIIATSPARAGETLPAAVRQGVEAGREGVRRALAARQLEATVTAVESPAEVQQAARQMGVTAGKYLVYLHARQAGLDVQLEELKAKSVARVLEERGVAPREILRHLDEDDEDGIRQLVKDFGAPSRRDGRDGSDGEDGVDGIDQAGSPEDRGGLARPDRRHGGGEDGEVRQPRDGKRDGKSEKGDQVEKAVSEKNDKPGRNGKGDKEYNGEPKGSPPDASSGDASQPAGDPGGSRPDPGEQGGSVAGSGGGDGTDRSKRENKQDKQEKDDEKDNQDENDNNGD